ncbi:MAG: hypothetical protein IT158_07970 [Bryobacterales bacterium]|nr:hypothetical protein [Bryobacterales bacterium]
MRTAVSLLLFSLLAAPAARPAVEDDFDYFVNNWNVVGLPDYMFGARITPDSEMLLAGGAAIQVRTGRGLAPLTRKLGKRAMEGWLPVIQVADAGGGVRYDVTFWATPLPDSRDWRKAFRWPGETENFLCWISVKATNASGAPAEARADVRPVPAAKPARQEFATAGKHTREYAWNWTLAPGESREGIARYTFYPISEATRYDGAPAGLWLDRTVSFWREIVAPAARIAVPCRKATRALLAAHVCQMIANDLGVVHGGEGFYDEFYIRDGAYQVMQLEEAGLDEFAARAIHRYMAGQQRDGRFESQRDQYDANGQAVWALWQYAKITGDRGYLERVYPRMLRAVNWTMRERRKAAAGSPFHGLLTAAPADGEYLWDGKHHIVGYDFWNLRGLLLTADAAGTLGRTGDAAFLMSEADEYRAAIEAAWKRAGVPYFPPSWETAGTHWGNTETLWPTRLFDARDPRVAASIEFLEKDFTGGYVEGTIRWKSPKMEDAIHPYMGAYTVMNTLVRGEAEKVAESFYWYLLHSTAANAFPEGIFYKRRFAWSDTIPHVTGASNYAILLRHMLVHEDGGDLHLLAAVPDWWLEEGREIRVERLPTHFGPMDLLVRGMARGVAVEMTGPLREAPRRIVLHLPESRPWLNARAGVSLDRRPDQKTRWDFPAVVARYRSSMTPEERRKWEALGL